MRCFYRQRRENITTALSLSALKGSGRRHDSCRHARARGGPWRRQAGLNGGRRRRPRHTMTVRQPHRPRTGVQRCARSGRMSMRERTEDCGWQVWPQPTAGHTVTLRSCDEYTCNADTLRRSGREHVPKQLIYGMIVCPSAVRRRHSPLVVHRTSAMATCMTMRTQTVDQRTTNSGCLFHGSMMDDSSVRRAVSDMFFCAGFPCKRLSHTAIRRARSTRAAAIDTGPVQELSLEDIAAVLASFVHVFVKSIDAVLH